MYEFGILMFIFALLTLLTGLYMFTGHKIGLLTGRAAYRNLNKEDWIKIGKYTMFSSVIIFIVALLAILFN